MKNNKRILALVLALVMVMTLFVGCGKQETETGSAAAGTAYHTNAYGYDSYSVHYYTAEDGTTAYEYMNEDGELVAVSQEDVDAWMNEVIATCEDYTFTNRELQYAYQEQYYQFYQVYGMYMMLMMDGSKALDEQVGGDGENTWQHMFVQAGADMLHRMAAVVTEAKKNNFDTAEAMKLLEEGRANLELSAEQVGYEDLDKFVVDSVGPGATLESYLNFYELQAIFQSYAEHLQAQVEVTDAEIDAYYAEKEEELAETYPKIDKNVVDVRHILIAPEETTAEDGTTSISDEAWAEAEAKANEIYGQWKSGEATEESFAELVPAHTEDPGSAETGGLYEDVYPGQMVTEFNDWCFADGRKVGDNAIVKTDYGYHIMFFSGEGDYVYWRKSVKDMITGETVNNMLAEIEAKYPMELDLTKAVMLDKTAPTVPAAEEEGTEQGSGDLGTYNYETSEFEEEEHVHTEESEHE